MVIFRDDIIRGRTKNASCNIAESLGTCSTNDCSLSVGIEPAALGGNSVNSFLEETDFVYPQDCHQEVNIDVHENMYNKLKYYFMNPIQKWNAKKKFPWKLIVQVVKIIIVTLQLALFGLHSYKYIQQHQDMTASLSHIFLEDWSAEPVVYPPSSSPYAVYTIPDFYHNVDHVIRQYSKIPMLAIGPYSYDSHDGSITPLDICIKWHKGEVFPFNSTIHLSRKVSEICLHVASVPRNDQSWDKFSTELFLKEQNFTIDFNKLVTVILKFSLKTIFLKSLSKLDVPECYKMSLFVIYDNTEQDGQLHVTLNIRSLKLNCIMDVQYENSKEKLTHMFRQLLNWVVIIMCSFSTLLCMRSLYSGQILRLDATKYFSKYFAIQMPTSEHFDFIDLWYVMIIISDVLVICGSIAKMNIEELNSESNQYNRCTVLFGVGNLFLWVGLLRYLGFFPKYNMLILTLKQALPNVVRFMVCAILLYAGFGLCGWIVLGPYHIKFRTISSTSECLFSIMNGDDMFATFALINTKDSLIWWFSRFYLYTFIALFVYVVISLFISLIMDTFETIKTIYIHGSNPQTTIARFLSNELFPHSSENQEFDYVSSRSCCYFKTFCSILCNKFMIHRRVQQVP